VDVLLGLLVFALVTVIGKPGLGSGAGIGVLVEAIVALYWIHVYSAFEPSGKTIAALAGLSFIQLVLASFAGTILYWGAEQFTGSDHVFGQSSCA